MAGRLAGDVALITGGLSGLGAAAAERFAAEGARVIVADLAAGSGGPSNYLRLDVTREADWLAARDAIEAQHGKLDILVNNAGIEVSKNLPDFPYAEWRKVMDVNIDGVFLGTKVLSGLMAKAGENRRGGASVVNIASILGHVGFAGAAAYAASKGAVTLFTKAAALEFAKLGLPIRVNSVHPGFVMTPLLQTGIDTRIAQGEMQSAADMLGPVQAATPMGRLGTPEEIAAGMLFLASTESSYMTGAGLVLDGGYTAQ